MPSITGAARVGTLLAAQAMATGGESASLCLHLDRPWNSDRTLSAPTRVGFTSAWFHTLGLGRLRSRRQARKRRRLDRERWRLVRGRRRTWTQRRRGRGCRRWRGTGLPGREELRPWEPSVVVASGDRVFHPRLGERSPCVGPRLLNDHDARRHLDRRRRGRRRRRARARRAALLRPVVELP